LPIRNVAAARSDVGVNRTDLGAKALVVARNVVLSRRKNGLNLFHFALGAISALTAGETAPLALSDAG